jgi:hypothetical protein
VELATRREAQKVLKETEEQAKHDHVSTRKPKKVSNTQKSQEKGSELSHAPEGSGVAEKSTRSGRVVKTPHKP